MPAASARWAPRVFSTRPQRMGPCPGTAGAVASASASASAIAGTRSARTNDTSSSSAMPAATSAS